MQTNGIAQIVSSVKKTNSMVSLFDFLLTWTSLVAQMVKHLSTVWETWVQSLGREDPLEKEMATHSSTLAWKIPWVEDPCRLQVHGVAERRIWLSNFTFYWPGLIEGWILVSLWWTEVLVCIVLRWSQTAGAPGHIPRFNACTSTTTSLYARCLANMITVHVPMAWEK